MASSAELTIVIQGKDQASRIIADVQKNAQGLGRTLTDVGKIAGGFLAAQAIQGGAGAIVSGYQSISAAASRLQQARGGTTAVFKEWSGQIDNFARTADKSVGLSQSSFREFTTLVGGQLKRMTGDIQFAADKSILLAKIGADLAATYGGTTEQAMEAFSAALRGEADPAERFNLNLKQTVVNQRAVDLGLASNTTNVSDYAKAQAILSLILEQSADAQGQFGRETNTAAGAAEIANARWENMQAILGQKVLPVTTAITNAKTKLADVIITRVLPALEALYARYWPGVQQAIESTWATIQEVWPKVAPVFEFVANDIAAKVDAVIGYFKNLVEIVKGVVGAIDAFVRGDWSTVWDNLKTVAENGAKLAVNSAVIALGALPNAMLGIMEDVINIAIDAWNKVAGVFSKRVEIFGKNVNPLAGQDLTLGNVNLPRIPTPQLPFGQVGNILKSLSGFDFSLDMAATTADGASTSLGDFSESTDKAGKDLLSLSERLKDAQSALFGGPTREEAALQKELADLNLKEAQKKVDELPKVGPGASSAPVYAYNLFPPQSLEDQKSAVQAQLDLLQAQNDVQKARLQLADQSLLTEQKQNEMAEILIGQTETLTKKFGFLETAVGKFVDALSGGALSNAAEEAKESGGGYAIGTPYVPDDGMYMLHRGERVVTAAGNKDFSDKMHYLDSLYGNGVSFAQRQAGLRSVFGMDAAGLEAKYGGDRPRDELFAEALADLYGRGGFGGDFHSADNRNYSQSRSVRVTGPVTIIYQGGNRGRGARDDLALARIAG